MKKIYKTVIQVEILSDEPYIPGSLSDIDFDTTEGDCSRKITTVSEKEVLTGKEAVDAIKDQGSDPEFFAMDDEGNELE